MINLKEYNVTRVAGALKRRLRDIPDRMYWLFHPEFTDANKRKILRYKDIYKGRRCFVLGNGPSLKATDLTKLKGEICFGANRIYLIKDDVDFDATFLAAMDNNLLAQFHEEIIAQPQPKFISWKYRKKIALDDNTCLIRYHYKRGFDPNMTGYVWGGYTVTFTNLQLAYYMGFDEVIIIGCDHSYAQSGVPITNATVEGVDQNHFSEKYYTKGHTFRVPDYKKMEYAYYQARKAFEADGRKVFDATVGGKLQVFEKIDYNSLFSGEEK